jgi:hypothetical protein
MNKSSYTKEKIFQLLLEKSPYSKNENLDDVSEKIMSYPYMEKFLNQEGFIISPLSTTYEFNNHDIDHMKLDFTIYTQPFCSYSFLIQVLNITTIPEIHYDISEGSTSFGYGMLLEFLDKNPTFSLNFSHEINFYKNTYQKHVFLPQWLNTHLNNIFDSFITYQDVSIYFDDKFSARKSQSFESFYKEILSYHIYSEKENMEHIILESKNSKNNHKI